MFLVKQIIEVKPYELILKFNTGEIRKINFEKKLREWVTSPTSKLGQLLDKNYFVTVKLDSEMETVFWDNGIDFCPNVLYEMSLPISVEVFENIKQEIFL